MPIDYTKYLALQASVEADLSTAQSELSAAKAALAIAQAAADRAQSQLDAMNTVKRLLTALLGRS